MPNIIPTPIMILKILKVFLLKQIEIINDSRK